MTSELEEMGELAGLPGTRCCGGRGGRGRLDHPSGLLVLVVTRGSCPHRVPQATGQAPTDLSVCRWERASESRLSLFISVSLLGCLSLGLYRSSLRVPVSFLAPLRLSPRSPTRILLFLPLPAPLTPTNRREGEPPPSRQGRADPGAPVPPHPGALREAGVPERGPLASPRSPNSWLLYCLPPGLVSPWKKKSGEWAQDWREGPRPVPAGGLAPPRPRPLTAPLALAHARRPRPPPAEPDPPRPRGLPGPHPPPLPTEYEQPPPPVPSMEKKRTVYQMALSKMAQPCSPGGGRSSPDPTPPGVLHPHPPRPSPLCPAPPSATCTLIIHTPRLCTSR